MGKLTRFKFKCLSNGNVALDCGRILGSDPRDLAKTDITATALSELSKSQIKNIYLVGRKGPLESKFAVKELRELFRVNGLHGVVSPDSFSGYSEANLSLAV